MEPWLVQALVSMLGGGLAGGILTLWYNGRIAKQRADAREKAIIASLQGEIEHILSLCDYNSKLETDKIAPFTRFPSVVMARATFDERHALPHLKDLQRDLEFLTLGVNQVNQLIHLHELMWIAPEVISTHSQGATVERRQDLQHLICKICADERTLIGVVSANGIYLRSLADGVLREIGEVRAKIS